MINVSSNFRPHIKHEYPANNRLIFEEWFYQRYNPFDNKSDRLYLPIFPTSYQVNANYSRDRRKMSDMQSMLNQLDRSKKYFTVCQYDDGLKFDLYGLDIIVCGMGGGRIDLPLPLTCQPHPFDFTGVRNVFASFLGGTTHDLRKKMLNVLAGNPKYSVSTRKHSIQEYCRLMSESIFALCPRGYGDSSFRIAEALQYGAVPIYISDKFIIPFNKDFSDYGVLITADQISNIDQILSGIPLCDVYKKQQAGKEAYKNIYSYEGSYKNLMKMLCNNS